jgi:hypothetical protein
VAEKVATRRLASLRKRLNDAAAEAGLKLRWHVDTQLKSPAWERRCWFTGPDATVAIVEEVMGRICGPRPEPFIQPRGFLTTLGALAGERTPTPADDGGGLRLLVIEARARDTQHEDERT